MIASVLLRGCLTALAVAAVLLLLRRVGPRAGGLAAAIPVTSAPALAWMAWEQGPAFAAASATAALLATGMTGAFALFYALFARRSGPHTALLAAAVPALLLTRLASGLGHELAMALPAAALMLAACLRLMPVAAATPRRAANERRDLLVTVLVSGAVTTLIGLLAPRVPALLCGLVAALPVIGICTTVAVHRQQGSAAVVTFLGGYANGLVAKLGFLAVLAGTLTMPGPGWLPWLSAPAFGLVAALALARLQAAGANAGRRASPHVALTISPVPH